MTNWGSIKEGRQIRLSYFVAGVVVFGTVFLILGFVVSFILALVW